MQVETAADIAKADKLIFPGVGSYGQAMTALGKMPGFTEALKEYILVRPPAWLLARLLHRHDCSIVAVGTTAP